ncbi:hypothetical protein J2T09_005310 [Neorhizobium huautlense]|uniref:Uncharacterized protein n=1 Tax=Neorhizobium huautlense TaxID=67774 RepID=A0ABT9Q1C5_9HYPH|nr:hypothetical protein [Neorhizobium huautlense]MDP9840523.1 hypothetical protein [Neorhizobium huautlense]
MTQIWFFALVAGATLFAIAISVASKKMMWLGVVLSTVGVLGVGFYFFNGSQAGPNDPPDVSSPSR